MLFIDTSGNLFYHQCHSNKKLHRKNFIFTRIKLFCIRDFDHSMLLNLCESESEILFTRNISFTLARFPKSRENTKAEDIKEPRT